MRISYWSSDVCSSDLDIVRKRLQKAVDAPDDLYPLRCEDTPGCIPIDLFGPAGSITQAQLDSVSADHYRDIKADLRAFVLNLSGPLIELPYGTVKIAAGAEYREESYSQIQRSEENTSELQALMRISYAVFCLTTTTTRHHNNLFVL